MELQHIPLENLHISKLNMRHGRRKPEISDILPSIRTKGVQQPLLVRQEGDGFGVIAGRRRWFCLKQLEQDTGQTGDVPCSIMDDGDDAEAMEASLIENTARLDPDEMQQFVAFKRLADEGRPLPEIARLFGVSELTVKRRLAIANLLPQVRKLYTEEEIDGHTLMALTLASEDQQRDWLAMFKDPEQYAPRGRNLKSWLLGGGEIETGVALFDLKAYDGLIYEDLFGERSVFADAEKFWASQNNAIAALRDGYLDRGWTKVTVLDRGAYLQKWEYDKTAKREGGAVFIEVRHSGEVIIHTGLVKRAAKKAPGKADAPKPELSRPLENYIDLHRHAAVRATLVKQQGLALRMLVAHLVVGSDLVSAMPEPRRCVKEETEKSVDQSPAQRAFLEERNAVCALLGLDQVQPVTGGNGDGWYLCKVFRLCQQLSDDEVMRILTFIMAETLAVAHDATDLLGAEMGVDMNDYWQADDAFFDLLRDKQVINALVAETAGEEVANANLTETAKVQKQILRDAIAGENGRTASDGWLPGWFSFPAGQYLADRACALVRRADRLGGNGA